MVRDGVCLAHYEAGEGRGRPIVLIHGWGCDTSFFEPQQAFFAQERRTISVDLRGHGDSDAPLGDYSMSSLADDVAWQCRKLGVERPVLVGHSMGGHIALQCAIRHSDLVEAVVMIDSVLFPSAEVRDHARMLAGALNSADHPAVLPGIMDMLFSPTDSEHVRSKFAKSFTATPKHVLIAALLGHVADEGLQRLSLGCTCPIVYIGADAPLTDRASLVDKYPLMRVEQTTGAGHFSPLLVPGQINAILQDIAARL